MVICDVLVEVVVDVDVSISVVAFTDVVAGIVDVIGIGWVVFNWVVPMLETVLASDVGVGELVSVESVEDSVDVCSIVFVVMSVDVCWLVVPVLEVSVEDSVDVCSFVVVFMSVDVCWMVVPMLEVSVEDSVEVCSIVSVVISVGFVVDSPVVIVVSAVDGSVVGMVVVESECCVVARAEVVFC